MKINMSPSERFLRLLFTLMVSILYSTKMLEGELLLILGVIAAVFFITAVSGFRPLYAFLGHSSRKKKRYHLRVGAEIPVRRSFRSQNLFL